MHSLRRLILDFGPLLAFFIAYRTVDLLAATATLVVCTLIALGMAYLVDRRVALVPLFSAIIITIMGGLTLYLHNDIFIKIKPTIINTFFAIGLLASVYFKKLPLKKLFSDVMQLTDEGWQRLSVRWGFFFFFLAALNEIIWRNFSTDFWVNFKVFGMFTLTMVFTASQIPLIKKYWIGPTV